jgi:hypothetical protein
VAPESRQRIGVGTPYCIRAEELQRYDSAIDDFLRAAGFEMKRWGASSERQAAPAALSTRALRF